MAMGTDMDMEATKTNTLRTIVLISILCPLLLNAQTRRVSAFIFQPEWYAGFHLGGNMTVAEGFPEYNWLQSTALSARPVIGYQFSPALGARAALGIHGHRWNDPRAGNDSILSFASQSLHADIMLNISNLVFGYSLNAPMDFSLFGGAGVLHRNRILPDNGMFSYLVRGGAQIDYRFTQFLELNIAAELNVTADQLNAFTSGTPVDLFPAVLVGLTWHFRTNKPFRRGCCD